MNGHKIKHIAVSYNEILNSIGSKATVFFLLEIFFFLILLHISVHLYFPRSAYWKVLRTDPLKLQHVLRLTDRAAVLCNSSLARLSHQIHHDQSFSAANIDSSLHFLCSCCRTDQVKAYFQAASWFKEENNFGEPSGLIRALHSGKWG